MSAPLPDLAKCVHCGTRIINSTTGECPACGCEVADTTMLLEPGSYVLPSGEWRTPTGEIIYAAPVVERR